MQDLPSWHGVSSITLCNAQRTLTASLLVIGITVIGGCSSTSPQPAPTDLLRDRHLAEEVADWSTNDSSEASRHIADAQANAPASSTVHSSANESRLTEHRLTVDSVQAPLDSLLFALAKDAGLELDLHAPLAGTVTLRATDQTLQSVLQQLSQQQAMRWELSGSVLNVWGGAPYTATYSIDYLNIDRSTQSSVGLATRVGTINADASSQTSGIANNSQTLVENRAEHRFWQSLANDLEHLLSFGEGDAATGYTINRDAGLITLHGSVAAHQTLNRYLEKLNQSAQRQVLIEATVVEVALSDRFEAGVDWQLLAKGFSGVSAAQVFTGAPPVNQNTVDRLNVPNGLVSLVQRSRSGDITATLSLLEQFGDVRILSRPRIIALNNQSSVLKVVDNRVYFTVNVERQRTDEQDEIITETEIHTVPVGLVMNVTPFISRSGHVMLNVRPTLSRILGFVNDPNPELAAASVRNGVPEIQVREMESMLRVASGDVAIIGGLMQDTLEDTNRRLPGLGKLPLVRHLFSQKTRNRSQTELLIVLRPTVMQWPAS